MTTKTKRKTAAPRSRRLQSRRELQTMWLAQEIYARSVGQFMGTVGGGGITEESLVHRSSVAVRAAEIFFYEFDLTRDRRKRMAARSTRKKA